MTKNIEDLLYRGDSLEKMGEISSRLRDDSKKYRRAAVRINWELLLKQVIRCGTTVLSWIFTDGSKTGKASPMYSVAVSAVLFTWKSPHFPIHWPPQWFRPLMPRAYPAIKIKTEA